MEILEVKNLNFTYPQMKKPALTNVNLSVRQGEFLLLCGESGCGKTTLLRLLKRELAPYGEKSGLILFEGVKQEALEERTSACSIGYVMQNPQDQTVTDKVWHELAFGLENMGVSTSDIRRRVGEMASFFGIDEWFRKPVKLLSGGQKQLLNLASVMVMQPKLLILDEPTSQLDPIAASEFIQTLVKLNRELGTTILLTEHRLEEVFLEADRVGVMENGTVFLLDTPRETGKQLKNRKSNHRMLQGLPSAMRIYQGTAGETDWECPLTVREGRRYLAEHFKNDIRALETKEEQPCRQTESVISLKGVWFRYAREEQDILEDVSLEVRKGEILSILGGNGSGKTTLLRVISHVNRAYRGKIKILGRKLKDYRGQELYQKTLASLPQDPQTVFCRETIREDYEEIRKVMGETKEEFDRLAGSIAQALEISHLLDQHPYDLSGGEQQKAAIGKLLLQKPKIFLMDEPTKGIDASGKQRLIEIMMSLREQGMTILLVTHDIEFAAQVSDRCGMFFDRQLTCLDTPGRFFTDNSFYTTAASRISRGWYDGAVTCRDVIALCRKNGRLHV